MPETRNPDAAQNLLRKLENAIEGGQEKLAQHIALTFQSLRDADDESEDDLDDPSPTRH